MSADRLTRLEERRASIEAQVVRMLQGHRYAVMEGDPDRIDVQQARIMGFVGGIASVALAMGHDVEVPS